MYQLQVHVAPGGTNLLRKRLAPQQLGLGLLSLAATAVVGVCLLVAVPANREALSSLVSKHLHGAAARLAS